MRAARFNSWRRSLLGFSAALLPALLIGSQTVAQAPVAAASPSFAFNWAGQPAAPQEWVPAAMNDWDLLESNGGAGDTSLRMGSFQGSHGTDCGPPPAAHPIALLVDTAYICKDHMMTAPNDGAVFFTPNQLADFSHGTATVTFQVSTFRASSRDWWEIWLTPFSENFVSPTDTAPVFEGPPSDAVHIQMEQQDGCQVGQAGPNWTDGNNGAHIGTSFSYNVFRGGNEAASGGSGACMEDLAVGGPSSKTRSTFELDVSQGHLRFGMSGPSGAVNWVDSNVNLPFNQAVVTWGHRSYNPSKACGFNGTCGPNTFHWSNVSISPTVPFTMLRPIGNAPVHNGTPTTVTLPAAAPANSFLRFAAFGSIKVSYDHGAFTSPHMQDTGWRAEGASNYFTPVPQGTKTITFQGSQRGGADWWIEDVSVWASTAPVTVPVQTTPTPPAPTPTATPAPQQTPTPVTGTPVPTPGPVHNTPPPVRHPIDDRWWRVIERGWVTWWRLRH